MRIVFTGWRAIVLWAPLFSVPAPAQQIPFEFKSYAGSPIAFVEGTPGTFRTGTDRRMFVTVKNEFKATAIALVFEQDLVDGDKREILTIERVSIIMKPGEKKRLSVSVDDIWDRIQPAAGSRTGKPVMRIVVVEFVEGGLWSAPVEPVR